VSAEEIIGLIAAAAAGYLVLLAVRPVHRCPRCRGRKVAQRGIRFSPCGRCKGTGKAYRRGAVTAHRMLRVHVWPWVQARIIDRIASQIGGG
jgi:hypothetical protein